MKNHQISANDSETFIKLIDYDMTNKEYVDERFSCVDFYAMKILNVTFKNCTFFNCSFSNIMMIQVTFIGCKFVDTHLRESIVKYTKIIGIKSEY